MIILGTNSIKDTGYDVANSCRFNKSDTAYMQKTTSAGNRKTWSFSTWLKRSSLGTQVTFGVVQTSTGNDNIMAMQFTSANKLEVWDYAGGITAQITTNRLFRDTSAWMHILVSADTTSGTANNRLRLYINGTEERGVGGYATDTMPSQNYDFDINQNSKVLKFGAYDGGSVGSPADFYYAETVFVDGTALSPTDVGEFDSDSGIWKPIDVSGLTFGTNGFYLNYEDASNLGNDANGGTDLTEVNLSATDQSTDTCTNNFATLNALANYYFNGTLSEGNLKVVSNGSVESYLTGTIAVSTGKWYWEIKVTASGSNHEFIGIADKLATASNFTPYSGNSKVISYYGNNGDSKAGSTTTNSSYGATYTTGDIIGVAMDLDNNKLYFSKNGTFQNSGDPTSGSTGTGALAIDASPADGVWYPQFANIHNTSSTFEANFGSPSFAISSGNTDGNGYGNFEYAVPSGYYSLNTKNLAEYG